MDAAFACVRSKGKINRNTKKFHIFCFSLLLIVLDEVMSPVRSHPRHALTSEHLRAGDLVTGGACVPCTPGDPGQGDQETGQ